MIRFVCAAVLIVLLSGPTYSASAASPDLSTPKKAAVEFAKGMETGDMDAAKAASAGSEEDFKVVQVISDLIRSARELRGAAVEKFGDAGKSILPGGDEMAEFVKRVDGGTEKISGDTATVGQPDERNPMKLKKVSDETWRVDLASIPEKDQITKMMPKIQGILSTGASNIKSGKYKTLEEAKDAISEQMFGVISEHPASQPAPEPKK